MGNMDRETDEGKSRVGLAIVTRKISKIGDGRTQCFRTSRLALPPCREVLLGIGLAQLVAGRHGLIPAGNRSRRGGSGELCAASRGPSSAREEVCSKSSYYGGRRPWQTAVSAAVCHRAILEVFGASHASIGYRRQANGLPPLHLRHPEVVAELARELPRRTYSTFVYRGPFGPSFGPGRKTSGELPSLFPAPSRN